ncbi:hypothetical protein KI655_21515 [Vibrio sp. D404a]|uniref:hypothetical protein n=1 Tax=unclassified Vibrio TaxID=2614977 RepID=UPI00255606C4|nr:MULTISPECIES: hypothetical protein [unclassified Vibrio]MDK9739878.1 hypothetical protein [Vibrio sp. D404a]MDK9799206.1 hypothetical protein [Vibrio sp. D449a]
MFEPSTEELDPLKIASYLNNSELTNTSDNLSESDLSEATFNNKQLDALLVSALDEEQSECLISLCEKSNTSLLCFENPSNDAAAVARVIDNLMGKLQSHEMPNNIDVADLRNLSESGDLLFGFDNHSAALDFLDAQNLGKVVGGVYLAHGTVELSQYEQATNELLTRFPDSGYLCSSFYGAGLGQCTIVLSVKAVVV